MIDLDGRDWLFYFCSRFGKGVSVRADRRCIEMLVGHVIAVETRRHRAAGFVAQWLAVGLFLVAFVCGPAAADVVLNYAVEADGKTGSGQLESCGPDRICRFRAADLDVELIVYRDADGVTMMDMVVQGASGCCYTVDTQQRFRAVLKSGLQGFAIYRRMSSGSDEFVRTPFSWNRRIGTIYLGFQKSR
ncbi:hypothetical protein [Bradyrhizobium sp. SRS-191]|uniref:hypothetical protein n=1 Tax=Bradyrhizobium sp. SRS-191 TaxID=2962606 RepID=UPI00211DC96D|nr:hypothetical protein [Bradyrhizobium sp. SRS-191]